MNNVQALIAARNQFALRNLTQESLRLILPSYYEAMQGVLRLLEPMPDKKLSVEREFWLKQQLANIRGQFKALGDRVEEVVPAADLRAWEIGLENADAMLREVRSDALDQIRGQQVSLSGKTTSGVTVTETTTLPEFDSGQSELFIKESNPLGEFIRPQITPQQVVAAAKKEGFSSLLTDRGKAPGRALEDVLPAMLKSQADIIEKKLRTGFLLGQTNDEIVRSILTDRRGRAQVEAVVRTSMMEASQAAHDAFYQANNDFSWTDDTGKRHEVKLIKGYEWDASLDDRVCPICAPLDGITREKRDAMPAHPAHFNCRCQILPMTGTTKALREQGVLQKRTVGEQLQGMTDEQKRGVLGSQGMVKEWNRKITQAKYQKDPQRLVRDLLRPGMAAEVKAKPPKKKVVKKAAPSAKTKALKEKLAASKAKTAKAKEEAAKAIKKAEETKAKLNPQQLLAAKEKEFKELNNQLLSGGKGTDFKGITAKAKKVKTEINELKAKDPVLKALEDKKAALEAKLAKADATLSSKAPPLSPELKAAKPPKAALRSYTGQNFAEIRAEQFRQAEKAGAILTPYERSQVGLYKSKATITKQANEIEAFLKRGPKYKGEVYRTLNLRQDALEDLLAQYKKGGKTHAMESWTTNRDLNYAQGGDQRVLLKTKSKNGVDISSMSEFVSEDEVLMPAGQRYKLKKATKKEISPSMTKKGVFEWIIELEEL